MNERRSGLSDGFEEFKTPTDGEYREALRSGLVAIDTNVLLNLYRYDRATREDLFSVLDALGDRLFIPHQVAAEFWRNRENTIRSSSEESDRTTEVLDELKDRSIQTLTAWAKRLALPGETLESLSRRLREAYEQVSSEVDGFAEASLSLDSLDTNDDPILTKLTQVLAGKVGPPLVGDELVEAHREAERRSAAEEPPGYRDKSKKGSDAFGDYLVWAQLVKESGSHPLDVLLVTGDVKEDWWRKERGQTRGPRLELSAELRATSGRRLFMLRPENLLARAKDSLKLSIRAESVQDAERVDRLTVDRERSRRRLGEQLYPLEKLPDGKRGDYLDTLIEMAALAHGEPHLDDYVEAFQQTFPTITLKDVARRRMRVLVSLDLVSIADDQVRLTANGEQLLEDRSLDVLQECFMRRIAGASEIGELAATVSPKALRHRLRELPPDGLSSTQALLVLRYMEQLDLA
jgi:PIN like domain